MKRSKSLNLQKQPKLYLKRQLFRTRPYPQLILKGNKDPILFSQRHENHIDKLVVGIRQHPPSLPFPFS